MLNRHEVIEEVVPPRHPLLSVVIVIVGDTVQSTCDTRDLAGNLEALAHQIDAPPMEVIVPYHSGVTGIDELRSRFPDVDFVQVEDLKRLPSRGGSREHHDELRACGMAVARGEIVAFLEDHVRPDPHWSAGHLEAHRQPYAAVGGAIQNGINRCLNWAAYFCDLGRYQNPVPAGQSSFASLVNTSYKRAALESIRPIWQDSFNETKVNRALIQRGEKLALHPGIVVHQFRSDLKLGTALKEFFIWGRSYGRIRGELVGNRRRLMLTTLAPLLPALLVLRLTANVIKKGRAVGPFIAAVPFTVLLTISWSWGELVGYLAGGRPRPAADSQGLPSCLDQAIGADARDEGRDTLPAGRLSISVVIAWVNPLELLLPGLQSLEHQLGRLPDEVIVVSRRDEAEQDRLRGLFPRVTVISAPANTPITALRSIGIKHARGKVIAVTEDHCVLGDNWVGAIEESMKRNDCDVVGGPVENASTARQRDWAAFLTEYARAIKPTREDGGLPQLPGNNIAYKRHLVDGLCSTLDRGLWESFSGMGAPEGSPRVNYNPEMLVFHRRPFGFRYFVSQRYHYCRSYAGMRCQSFTILNRLKYGVGSVILPPMLLLRGLLTLRQKRRLVGRYLSCLPLICIYVTVGALGEMVGYFLDGGDSLRKVE